MNVRDVIVALVRKTWRATITEPTPWVTKIQLLNGKGASERVVWQIDIVRIMDDLDPDFAEDEE